MGRFALHGAQMFRQNIFDTEVTERSAVMGWLTPWFSSFPGHRSILLDAGIILLLLPGCGDTIHRTALPGRERRERRSRGASLAREYLDRGAKITLPTITMNQKFVFAIIVVLLALSLESYAGPPPLLTVPGVVIDHIPASMGVYVGSPSLAILANGDFVATHDHFGPKTTEHQVALTSVFRSSDHGRTWKKVSEIGGAFWSSLFVHRGVLYLLGTDRHHGNILIRRSTDGGTNWTIPTDSTNGLLRDNGEYHCAPVPVIEHGGRLWRAFEWRNPPVAWGINYRAGMLSAAVDADLLKAANWTSSNFLPSNRTWNGGDMGAWLEGNAVVTPEGQLVDILRVQTKSSDERAALVHISQDGKTASFDPATGFVSFPGGAKKFTIRFDLQSKLYWSLASIVHDRHRAENAGTIRNTLALTCSPDLTKWTVRCLLLYHPDWSKHGFQYVDWLFDGDDIIAACRTAYDGAHNAHDANFLTFHRIRNFRTKTMADSIPVIP
jgi:hypothetical protein